ncbi:antitoxin component YwqK of YwqJK toxin-antitoxin module [Parabacteroides sp. PH5-13]|uniref:toxin-antitoxin system YwqK family antitoxin n=1 Tax=unclassified Parabacteroides TaxID=2649774 RepID=UPI0024764FB1|nr:MULTISPECIES: hypothetical protein [unclassified Parabacteroides]MDH6305578.1 antitoxin component YwqK of YwqJK toxin-antitoxin module [Parabacteroides sp. PH5-39]MDH6319867.1 antitoxin component YwqK of YwqJK toxin-antitoxin module [Parabacteroides sp. PH5-13]MDH6323542.1 antitoxin component YwqK of YwqJK toxin-antitoxin module [Parabacteroides sp. PH5-8]MDH6384654.1 antitoxin component YwqK of YwqJK toxin-antitoxin module [Parabacteroides sp. PH5-17]MDH6394009.1 antitoxin component YwqK o
MKRIVLLLGVLAFTLLAQGQVKINDLKMTNLGDGRMYAEYENKEKEEDKPINGKVRIITGYTTEYIDAEFAKGFAVGKWEYYKDNKLSEVTHYEDGRLNGEIIRYYPDGTSIKEKSNMKNGKVNGITTTYSQAGTLTYEKGMKEGIEDGPERRYDDNGELVYDNTYKDGKQVGKSFAIINKGLTGEYTQTAYYKDGKYDGEYLETYKDGDVKVKGKYINGKKDGLWESLHSDGSRKGGSETYKNGVVIRRVTYYTDGSIEMERNFNDQGKQHGIEKKYAYEGGHLTSEKNFVNGKQVGKQMRRVSSNNGSFFEYSNYNESGKKHGEYREVFEDNKKEKTKGQYVNDKKDGKWYYGNSLGFYKEEIYENGKLTESKTLVK